MMLSAYAPLFVLLVLVGLFTVGNLVLSEILGRRRAAIGKDSAYECGMGSVGSARIRLSIHFYLVAVLFILFDVESLLLIPWAVAARGLAAAGHGGVVLVEVAAFVTVLAVGLAFVWRRGGLEWER
jgi:NADH-quinone oxidoreductase subunit A